MKFTLLSLLSTFLVLSNVSVANAYEVTERDHDCLLLKGAVVGASALTLYSTTGNVSYWQATYDLTRKNAERVAENLRTHILPALKTDACKLYLTQFIQILESVPNTDRQAHRTSVRHWSNVTEQQQLAYFGVASSIINFEASFCSN